MRTFIYLIPEMYNLKANYVFSDLLLVLHYCIRYLIIKITNYLCEFVLVQMKIDLFNIPYIIV